MIKPVSMILRSLEKLFLFKHGGLKRKGNLKTGISDLCSTQTLGAKRGSNLGLSDADIYRPKTMTLHFQTLQLQARLGHAPTASRYLISQKLRLGYSTCTHDQHACAKGAHSAGTLSRKRRTIPAKYKEGNAPGRNNGQLREVPNRTCGMCLVTIATQDSTKPKTFPN